VILIVFIIYSFLFFILLFNCVFFVALGACGLELAACRLFLLEIFHSWPGKLAAAPDAAARNSGLSRCV